ncbi:MAG: hypothetical protein LUE29_05055 [Lachnospiraceae bacterium]|nr:hypothetical protein [Lachnospiraceae bacterium]
MIKKRLLAACMAVVLLVLPLFSACKGAENELMDVPTEASEDEDELDSQWVLSEEMMEDDHLYAEVKDGLTIDAYFTPLSYYEDGVAVWEPSEVLYEEMGEENYSCEELAEDDPVLGVTTIGTVTDALDTMAQALGETYESQWELAKNGGSYRRGSDSVSAKSYSYLPGDRDVTVYTSRFAKDITVWNGMYPNVLPTVERTSLRGLSVDTVKEAVTQAINEIYPDVAAHYSLYCYSQYYEIRYFASVEGIPLKQAPVKVHIDSGEMAEDSFGYQEEYNDESNDGYGFTSSGEYYLALIYISDSGLWLSLYHDYLWTQFREAREVLTINDILPKIFSALELKSNTYDITVENIELVMARTSAENEDGTYRVVYAPYWMVDYTYVLGGETEHEQLAWDAYTGVNAAKNYTPILLED